MNNLLIKIVEDEISYLKVLRNNVKGFDLYGSISYRINQLEEELIKFKNE